MKTNMSNDKSCDISPERIARLLTQSTQQLDPDTLAALRKARQTALERQSLNRPVFLLSTGNGIRWLMPHSTHQWVGMVIVLAAMLLGGASYLHHMHENEIGHLDAAILTDDMPLEVFVD